MASASTCFLQVHPINYAVAARLGFVKSYGQRCPLARALDVIGDRWTFLVVRELLLGPRRYTDLLDGLPGVGTNILAARLAALQAGGVVTKRELPAPTAVTVYELTDAGRALAPTVRSLSAWGEQHGAPATAEQAVRPAWVLLSVARRGAKLGDGRSCELWVGNDVFELAAADGELSVASRPAPGADAVVKMAPAEFYALASQRTAPEDARATVDGDLAVAAAVLQALSGAGAS
jgi:DNA-binding HxlR family transcriptional regulator